MPVWTYIDAFEKGKATSRRQGGICDQLFVWHTIVGLANGHLLSIAGLSTRGFIFFCVTGANLLL